MDDLPMLREINRCRQQWEYKTPKETIAGDYFPRGFLGSEF